MTMPVIMDVAVVVILVGVTLLGARRGLVKTLAGLVIIIVALFGAGMIASTLADPVTKLVVPAIEEKLSSKMETLLEESVGDRMEDLLESGELSISGLGDKVESPLDSAVLEEALERLGLEEKFRTDLLEKVEEIVTETGAPLVTAVIEAVVRGIVYGILYILAFLLLVILLHILVAAMNLVMKLPVLNGLNRLGGALVGLAEGVLLIFLVIWIARVMGVSFETEALADAHILRIFTGSTPLSILSFLK